MLFSFSFLLSHLGLIFSVYVVIFLILRLITMYELEFYDYIGETKFKSRPQRRGFKKMLAIYLVVSLRIYILSFHFGCSWTQWKQFNSCCPLLHSELWKCANMLSLENIYLASSCFPASQYLLMCLVWYGSDQTTHTCTHFRELWWFIFCHWDTISDTHNLKEVRFV